MYVPFGFNLYGFHHSLVPFLLSSILILLKKERPDTSLFFTANTNSSSNDPPLVPWIDAAQPPHGTAMHIVVARWIILTMRVKKKKSIKELETGLKEVIANSGQSKDNIHTDYIAYRALKKRIDHPDSCHNDDDIRRMKDLHNVYLLGMSIRNR